MCFDRIIGIRLSGRLQHLHAIRHIRDDQGWIRELLEEADNERMHLMTFIKIAQPTRLERWIIMVAQAVVSYTQYLGEIDAGRVENVPAPQIAKDYWTLAEDARLREVVVAVRADEAAHRDTNHDFANKIASGEHP